MALVRAFWEGFGPTCKHAVAVCRKVLDEGVTWESPFTEEAPVKSLDDLVAFLDRARESGVERYRLEVKHVAADEDVVLSRRVQTMMDKDGNVLDVLDVMAVTRVMDGKIVWNRDYFYGTRVQG
ncbi:nuclear transport factor 2 family protein [Streptomyces sp. BBFR25]|uniref:nuclear transport factor 2 family protein n=1 Tax=Streptomyces sp. BBFR25 TaxID=3372855 RepID=UPI0037DC14AF